MIPRGSGQLMWQLIHMRTDVLNAGTTQFPIMMAKFTSWHNLRLDTGEVSDHQVTQC